MDEGSDAEDLKNENRADKARNHVDDGQSDGKHPSQILKDVLIQNDGSYVRSEPSSDDC